MTDTWPIDGGMECTYVIRRNRCMPEVAQWIHYCACFDNRLGTRESYCILVYVVWLPFSLSHGGELLLGLLVRRSRPLSTSPRPHDDVTLTDLIMARHIVAIANPIGEERSFVFFYPKRAKRIDFSRLRRERRDSAVDRVLQRSSGSARARKELELHLSLNSSLMHPFLVHDFRTKFQWKIFD